LSSTRNEIDLVLDLDKDRKAFGRNVDCYYIIKLPDMVEK